MCYRKILLSSPFMKIQWKWPFRAVPLKTEAAAKQGKHIKSCRGSRGLGSRTHIGPEHPSHGASAL